MAIATALAIVLGAAVFLSLYTHQQQVTAHVTAFCGTGGLGASSGTGFYVVDGAHKWTGYGPVAWERFGFGGEVNGRLETDDNHREYFVAEDGSRVGPLNDAPAATVGPACSA